MDFFLDVVLPIPLERLFTYRLSREEASLVKRGMRVAVPFGKSKIYTALTFDIHHNEPQVYEAKEIHQLLDDEPIVTEIQFKHWQWIADYYMCTLGEVVRGALPGSFLLESETLVLPNKLDQVDEALLSDNEFLILEALRHQSSLKIDEISKIIDRKRVLPIVNQLVQKQAILLKETLHEQYRPKMEKYLRLNRAYESEAELERLLEKLARAQKQSQALLAFFQLKSQQKSRVKVNDFVKFSGISKAVIKALIDKEIFESYEIRADRVQFDVNSKEVSQIELSAQQEKAVVDIKGNFENDKVCLLYGVTSSGKTEVYLKFINEVIETGKQVLYLLPEIALTSQLINRLMAYFGNKIAVYHSKYSLNERVEVWNNVLHGNDKAQVIVGTRSALLLPFTHLGLIVVDEEHESSFKQFDPAPRYHARDAAIVLSNLHNSKCILGSATPSLETFFNTKSKKYGIAQMLRRYGDVLMPEIELVDIKEATRKKRMKGHFSEQLLEEISNCLAEKEQVILFQNRRGFAPIVECTTCGHATQCPNCDVSLTYHQHRNQLRCHYCGYHMSLLQSCQACGNNTLDTKGFGTEQIQEELLKLFPEYRIGRMDLDTTRGKYAYEKIINAFEQQEFDILVGTQMVTKGLDFRNVALVGIMNADSLLNFPDYRSHERGFQLMTQVAGRAGRTEKRGKVLIQTYNPYHQILHQVSNYDYKKMFSEQLYEREQFKYPPHVRIIRITLKDKDYNKLNEASDWFASSLRNVLKVQVLGPEYPTVARIRNQYLKNILIKINTTESITRIKNSIRRIENSFNAISQYRSIRLVYDVDHI
ncbi:replication restart helicase PriA [Croceitalea rosinachiae]|uniref:Replication restart protein PriA n=1 Tax=Croceitalea rosinachiae TaxID=3075596 RepID=A0ABU3AAL3_9FLAO|nr:primosomal protein N' [Croceitalea sp. F388]MDT0607226.1 primosomal protein N' [Croceitalea sp. F388]